MSQNPVVLISGAVTEPQLAQIRAAAALPLRAALDEIIAWLTARRLTARIRQRDRDLVEAVASSTVWRAQEDLLRSCKGVGPVLAATLLAAPAPRTRPGPSVATGGQRTRS